MYSVTKLYSPSLSMYRRRRTFSTEQRSFLKTLVSDRWSVMTVNSGIPTRKCRHFFKANRIPSPSISHTAYLDSVSDNALEPHCTILHCVFVVSNCRSMNPKPIREASVITSVFKSGLKWARSRNPANFLDFFEALFLGLSPHQRVFLF